MTTGFSFAGTALAGLPGVLSGGAESGSAPAGSSSPLSGLFSGLVDSNGLGTPASGSGSIFASLDTPSTATASVPNLSTLLAGLQAGTTTDGTTTDPQADPLAALQALLQGAGVQLSTTTPTDGTTAAPTQTATSAISNTVLQTLAAALQQVQQAAAQNGLSLQNLTDPAALKSVLKNLGVPNDKATALVSNIQDMLAKLKQSLKLDDSQLSALTPVIIAANVAPLLQNPLTNQPLVNAQTPVTFTLKNTAPVTAQQPNVSHAQNAIKQASSYPVASDVAREVAGIKSDSDKSKNTDAAEPAAPQLANAVSDATLPAVAVTIDPVGVSIRDVAKTSTTVGTRTANASSTVQSVAAGNVLAPVAGDVKFTWNGEDSAKPTDIKTAATTTDKTETLTDFTTTLKTHADWLPQGNAPAATTQTAATDATDFAKQLEQFQQNIDLAKRYDVAGQTVVQMKSLIDQGGGEIRIKLNPPELGQVHVELTVKDGTVSGKISASDPAVVNALASDIKQFGDGLKQAGFKLGSDGLSFMLSQQNQQQQQQQFQQQAQTGSATSFLGGDASDDTTAVADTTGWVSPDRLLDVNI